jgi:hypothetical protein
MPQIGSPPGVVFPGEGSAAFAAGILNTRGEVESELVISLISTLPVATLCSAVEAGSGARGKDCGYACDAVKVSRRKALRGRDRGMDMG